MMAGIARWLEAHWPVLEAGPAPQRGSLRWVLVNGGVQGRSKVVALVWQNRDPWPTLAVKFMRDQQHDAGSTAEYEVLQRLQPLSPPGTTPVARPLACFTYD